MPFVNIQILKGHPKERKDEIARRVTTAISELAQLGSRRTSGSCSKTSTATIGTSGRRV